MLSGNGRHRRPRQAPALVVAAGVTGSAMALPLLATGSATAADAATWDRVAECESGGQWSADTGNGRYGGLQLTQEGWERYGGLAYAPSPDLASRAQQIAVAEKALAQGASDWASCAPIAGLANDGAKPAVNPGPSQAPKAQGPVGESNRTSGLPASDATKPTGAAGAAGAAGRAGASASPSATPSTAPSSATPGTPTGTPATGTPDGSAAPTAPGSSATPDATGTPGAPEPSTSSGPSGSSDSSGTSDPSGVPSGDASSAAPGNGKHRGEAASDETGKAGTSAESGRHAADGGGSAGKVAMKSVADTAKDSGGTDSQGTSGAYTVKPGDNLSDIAQENELPGGWTALYDANRGTVGTDPDLILPGQSLELTKGSVAKAG
ncbi:MULTISPECIES: transglycosylase family protein [unclassified Streptomyces]|uniref:LysM peptidoglycan-binding domain-containing protein n=1 Tax=unclassified Streptomyces TaxID=2593676 RepID=UPI00166046B7|nr:MULTISPECIES: transglycosylase family protein [unclassified Streptomyces]MBD0708593.1 hypothetical protein [Streptomyces sp. CBMA291]MBD0713144.1 hypothetical protein [Streptomyces sp. CBMA370]